MEDLHNNSKPSIVVIGGGGGAPVMAEGLVEAMPGYNISAVVCTHDHGNSTGLIRDLFGGVAVGDMRKVMSAVSGNDGGRLFEERFGPEASIETLRQLNEQLLGIIAAQGADVHYGAAILEETTALLEQLKTLKGHTYGNLVLTALRCHNGGDDVISAVQTACNWLATKATVIPVTTQPHDLVMYDGKTHVYGEGEIDGHTIADPEQADVWLDKKPYISDEAYEAIAHSDALLIGPGSLFTTLLPGVSPRRIDEAISEQAEHGGKYVLIGNLIEELHATPGLDVIDFKTRLEDRTKRHFDLAVYNTNTQSLPAGEIGVSLPDSRLHINGTAYIGANLVGSNAEHNANDAIANLRSPIHHNPLVVADILKQHVFKPALVN